MRDLPLLLRRMQIIDPKVKVFSDCLTTGQATNLLKSIQIVSGFDPETGLVKKPSMLNRLGPSINIAWDILRNNVLLNQTLSYEGKQKKIFEYDSTQRLFKSEWKFKISSNTGRSRKAALTKVLFRQKTSILVWGWKKPLEKWIRNCIRILISFASRMRFENV